MVGRCDHRRSRPAGDHETADAGRAALCGRRRLAERHREWGRTAVIPVVSRRCLPVPGATGTTISFLPLEAEDDGSYFCRVSNGCYATDTNTVELEVVPLPVFIEQPASVEAVIGETITLQAEADALGFLVYQWRKVGVSGAIAAGPTLTITDAQPEDAGEYYVVAFTLTPVCTAESEPATVTVSHAPCDQDLDGDCDLRDMGWWLTCFGPAGATAPECDRADLVGGDGNVDLEDWAAFLEHVSGPR